MIFIYMSPPPPPPPPPPHRKHFTAGQVSTRQRRDGPDLGQAEAAQREEEREHQARHLVRRPGQGGRGSDQRQCQGQSLMESSWRKTFFFFLFFFFFLQNEALLPLVECTGGSIGQGGCCPQGEHYLRVKPRGACSSNSAQIDMTTKT